MKKIKNQKELAKYIGKPEATIINWRKNFPNLYQIVTSAINNDEYIEKEESKKILKLFELLEEKEKRMYLAEIEARILRKELK